VHTASQEYHLFIGLRWSTFLFSCSEDQLYDKSQYPNNVILVTLWQHHWWQKAPSLGCKWLHLMTCMIIVLDTLHISWFMQKAECKLTLFYPSNVFDKVQYGWDMLTQIYLSSNNCPWGCASPPEVSLRFIWICVYSPSLKHAQHSPEIL
jgi:hypothetical protein